jgi:outer membrane protein OmpA-like peptidoglycan-associated protein
MKKLKLLSVLLLCMVVVFTSCGTWNNTAKGTAIGVGGGAAVGAGVGALAGNTALGSIIGAAVGGTAGALIGKKMDKQKKELEAELEAALPEEETVMVESINEGQALKVTFDSGILFATNSSTLSAASKSALRALANSLEANPDTDIKIVGHTDSTGKVDYNQILSENVRRVCLII